MSLFKNKKKPTEPHWMEVIKEDIASAKAAGRNSCYGYTPVGQEKLLMSLPNDIRFTLEMRVENDMGAEYYYKFHF